MVWRRERGRDREKEGWGWGEVDEWSEGEMER